MQATGHHATALGYYTFATGINATAVGNWATASGQNATAIGANTMASGSTSFALGYAVSAGDETPASGFGDSSVAFGLIRDSQFIGARSQVRGDESFGIFMGAQDGLVMNADRAMGLFGGRFVMDPRVPAQQLDPRADMDLGASTDALLLPIGSVANRPSSPVNGMLRYNSQSGRFEGYQGGSWQDIVTGAAITTFLALTDTPSSYAGQANRFVRVNAGSSALEFTDQIVPSVTGHPPPTGMVLDDLGDVTIATPMAGQILTYSGGQWVNGTATGGTATPAGVNTNIQFNSGGNMGAASTFVYTSAGNLGLGTANPSAKTHIYNTSTTGNAALEGLRLTHERSTGSGGQSGIGNYISFTTETASNNTFAETARIESRLYDATNNSKDGDLRFYTLGANAGGGTTTATEAMRIDSNKTLYAGGMSNARISTIQGWNWTDLGFAMWGRDTNFIGEAGTFADLYFDYFGDGPGETGTIAFARARGTLASSFWSQQNDALGRLSFHGTAGNNHWSGSIEAYADENHSNTSTPGRLDFFTTPSGTTGVVERMSIKSNGRIQIGTGTPRARLDVNGAIQIGNDGETCSSAADRGSIRFNGTEFEVCRDHAQGWSPLNNAPVDAVCDDSYTFSSPGTFGYRVPANFGTLTIRMWGGGGGGGGADMAVASPTNGSAGVASTIISRGLSAGGGAGGARSTGAVGTGGAGGTAAGGDTNTAGNAGGPGVASTSSGAGGNAPGIGGGSGGLAAPYGISVDGNNGNAPGGGGSGGTESMMAAAEAGGGGSGAYVERILTTADIAPGTIISDIVIGSGGNGGDGGGDGGRGGNGRIVFDCASGPPDIALGDLNDVTITSPTNGQTLFYSGGQWVNGPGGGGGSIDGLSDAIANYTSNNIYLGQGVGGATTTGEFNTALGAGALQALTTGTANVAIGAEALAANTNGPNNIAIGNSALAFGTNVWGQIAIGYDALKGADGGQDNIALGNYAGTTMADGAYNIMIGDSVNVANPSGNYQLNIGDTIYGDMSDDRIGIGKIPAAGVELDVLGDIQYTGTITDVSDMRLKSNILPLKDRGSMLDSLDRIRTYSFTMKGDLNGQVEFGVMAQEINNVFPELVKVDESTADKYMSVNYVGLIAPLIEASKELKAENEALKASNDALGAQLSALESRLSSVEGDMDGMKVFVGYGIDKAGLQIGMLVMMLVVGGACFVFTRSWRGRATRRAGKL